MHRGALFIALVAAVMLPCIAQRTPASAPAPAPAPIASTNATVTGNN